jgi:hypothetical protein
MDAKDYLSGVYLDTHKFNKNDVIKLMEDYYNYRIEYERQLQLKKVNISVDSLIEILYDLDQGNITTNSAKQKILDLLVVINSLQLADDNTYFDIINYGLQWNGHNPLGWKTLQEVIDFAKSKHKLYKKATI